MAPLWVSVAGNLLMKALGIGKDIAEQKIEQKKELDENKHKTRIRKEQTKQIREQAKAESMIIGSRSESQTSIELTRGWKDEFALLLFLLPLWFILVIFPVMEMIGFDTTQAKEALHFGIDSISNLPEWYWLLVLFIVLKSFGVPVGQAAAGAIKSMFDRKKS